MRHGATASVFAMTLLAAAVGAAPNELTNSTFDTDASGREAATEVSLAWSSISAELDPGSGSARVDNQRSNSSDGAGMSQCVASGVAPRGRARLQPPALHSKRAEQDRSGSGGFAVVRRYRLHGIGAKIQIGTIHEIGGTPLRV
jgi:hypothetical protein